MLRRLPIRSLLLACAFASAGACSGKKIDEVCRPGSLRFTNVATLVATPSGVLTDLRVAAIASDFAVVWSSGPTLEDNDLYGRTVRHDGLVSSNEVRITQAAGVSSGIRLAPGPGGLGVSWSDGRFAQRVAMATVLHGLSPAVSPVVFQSPVIASDQLPVPAIAAIGDRWVVAWNGRGADGNDHLFAQVLTSSGAAGSVFPLAAAQEDRATGPSMAASSSGAVVIVDQELRVGAADADVWAYLVAGTGALGTARYGASSEAKDPEAVGFAGGAGVVWTDTRDEGRPDLWFAQFGGGEIRLTAGPDANTVASVASAGTGFLMTWIGGSEIRFRAMKGDGRPDGGLITVASEPGASDVAWNGFSAGVVWADSSGIWFRPLGCQ